MGREGSPFTPLRTLREWYNIVHWTPLIKNQDVKTQYLGSFPPFWIVFKRWPPSKTDKLLIKCNISLLPSVMLTFMSRTFKTLNFISVIESYGLYILYSRWPPLWCTIFAAFFKYKNAVFNGERKKIFVLGWDRKISPSRSPFVITWQAS